MSGVPSTSSPYSIEPITVVSSTCPAVRTTNMSPIPWSKMISAATRESAQPKMTANGCWAYPRVARRAASCPGCSAIPLTKRSLPAMRRCHAAAGVKEVGMRAPISVVCWTAWGRSLRTWSGELCGGGRVGSGPTHRDRRDAHAALEHGRQRLGVDREQGVAPVRAEEAGRPQAVHEAAHEGVARADGVGDLDARGDDVDTLAARGHGESSRAAEGHDDERRSARRPLSCDLLGRAARGVPREVLVAHLDDVRLVDHGLDMARGGER